LEIGHLFADIISGAQYLHDIGIAHLDHSLENVLLSEDGRALICDLGVARRFDQSDEKTFLFDAKVFIPGKLKV
jgi:serine/threonine protein kinase